MFIPVDLLFSFLDTKTMQSFKKKAKVKMKTFIMLLNIYTNITSII